MAGSVARASFMSVLQRFIIKFLGLFNTLILVRLIAPEDFGIVALAAAVQSTLEAITQSGLGMALIRMRTPTRAQYDTAFTLSVLRGTVIAVALVLTSGLQARFMGDARIGPVMYVQAAAVMLSSLESVRMADLHAKLDYDSILRFNVLQKLVGLAIAVPAAFWFRNYWALVISAPLNWLVMIPVSYRMAPYRPRLTLQCWRDFFNFSKWLMVGNLVHVIESNLMTFVVGRLNGITALGLFQVAFQVAALPISEIAAPLRLPAYAAFATMQNDRAAMRRQFLASVGLQVLVILPLSFGIALTAHEVTLLALGARWVDLIPLMQVVALFVLFDAVAPFVFNVFVVLGRQRQMVLTWMATVLLRLIAVTIGAQTLGVLGATYGMLLTAIVCAVLWSMLASRILASGPAAFGAEIWRPLGAGVAMAGVVLLLPPAVMPLPDGAAGLVLGLVAKASIGAITYAAVTLALWAVAGRPQDAAEPRLFRLVQPSMARLGVAWSRTR
jgi:O-antigen/teichoic acid export membrane protein